MNTIHGPKCVKPVIGLMHCSVTLDKAIYGRPFLPQSKKKNETGM